MRCNHLINDFLMEYLDGTLPLTQRVSFEMHLALCKSCRVYLDTYRKTVEATKSAMQAPAEELPQPPEDLIRAILASVPKEQV